MPRFSRKQNSSARPCGCAKKGPHNQKICSLLNEDSDDDNNRGRQFKISPPSQKTGRGKFNLSNLKAKSKQETIKVDDDTLQELMLHQVEDQENIWSLLDDAPHNTVQAYVYSDTTKSGDVTYFNKLNDPNLSDGHIFYVTRNGGVGVNSEVYDGGFSEGDMVGLIMVDLGNYYDLTDDDES